MARRNWSQRQSIRGSRSSLPSAWLWLTIVGLIVCVASGATPGHPSVFLNTLAAASVQEAPEPPAENAPVEDAPVEDARELIVTRFDFEPDAGDANYDSWPDDWVRRTGKGFPNYVQIAIDSIASIGTERRHDPTLPGPAGQASRRANLPTIEYETPPFESGDHALAIRLDGGAAEVSSPPIRINSHYSYALEGWVLLTPSGWSEANEAWISMTLTNREGTLEQTYRTSRVETVGSWSKLSLGPVVPHDPEFEFLTITLHVHPTRVEDIFGEAWFDSLQITHLPKLNAKTNRPYNLFTSASDVEIACSVSGMQADDAVLDYQLLDVEDRLIARRRLALRQGKITTLDQPEESQSPEDDPAVAAPNSDLQTNGTQLSRDVAVRQASFLNSTARDQDPLSLTISEDVSRDIGDDEWIRWKPRVPSNGFYRARVTLTNDHGLHLTRELTLVVMPSAPPSRSTQFGWNVPRQPSGVSFQTLVELFRESGVHWVMYPVWYAKGENQEGQRLGDLAERLTLERMEMIALVDEPPAAQRQDFSRVEEGISVTLRDKDVWLPAIEHVLTRLSFKIDWWQLGAPDDDSFVGQAQLERKITEIRDHLQKYGKNIRVGLAWNWLHETPYIESAEDPTNRSNNSRNAAPVLAPTAPWDFMLRASPSPLTAIEMTRYLAWSKQEASPIWTTMQPLHRDHYDLTTRVRDLVERMLAVQIAKADVVLIPDPFSSDHGILNDDLSPSELLLPFRTTSFELADAEYLGSLKLPSGSVNHLFQRFEDEVVMVVWNDNPTSETLAIGGPLTMLDCWGRTTELRSDQGKTRLPVGREPIFVTGFDPQLVEWQMKTQLDRDLIESVIGRDQSLAVLFENTFLEGVSGTVTVTAEELWDAPKSAPFKAAPGEKVQLDFPVTLRPSIGTSQQRVTIAFDVSGHQRHRFHLARDVEIGIENIHIDTAVQAEGDRLLVHATLVNETDSTVSFNLYLFAPERKRQRAQITQLEPGRERRTFTIDNASDLMNATIWLRAEEMRGDRVLNYRVSGPNAQPQ